MIASLSLSLEENGTPRYQQLRQQLLMAMDQGRLQEGDQLPSSRALAQMLGVSRSVVVQAYEELIAEGVLTTQPKRGVFVAQHTLLQAPRSRAVKTAADASYERFDSGVDVSVFPNKKWAASMRRAWLNPDPKLLKGEYEAGYPPLQRAICDYLYALRGLECVPEQVLLVAGNHDALTLLQHTLADDVEQWLLENPTYPPLRESFAAQTCQVLPVSEQGCAPPTTRLAWAAVLTPNRQYPLGICANPTTRDAWLNALADGHNFVIEDDYDNEFLYQGGLSKPWFQAAQHRPGTCERVFYIGSFSKVLFRGLRLGFIVAPLSQVSALRHSQKELGLFASQTLQPVVADFMVNGAFYRHLNRMRRHYRAKRDYLLQLLAAHLHPWFVWHKPNGGLHIVTYVKEEFSSEQWCRELNGGCLQSGLRLSWLQQHYAEQETAPKGLVLGFSAPTEEQLQAWIKRIAEVCQSLSEKL
ncbi:HTH-type transcriptional regulatory protein GabR [Marinomonas aquimarina]|uniref:HTH-type transcriptional regulatory protein GabR n=1 Tax=Marinomonas aquimarina TaxID=295068 RepID=A0A1A8T9G6_9GAMM|nr:PLP-dependent aminotransferase family protein [Marinomonas aquimarina]SBS29108.1 HTH-type transcriptional regulatory protein GabR [Marinomonas aquimarina]